MSLPPLTLSPQDHALVYPHECCASLSHCSLVFGKNGADHCVCMQISASTYSSFPSSTSLASHLTQSIKGQPSTLANKGGGSHPLSLYKLALGRPLLSVSLIFPLPTSSSTPSHSYPPLHHELLLLLAPMDGHVHGRANQDETP
jgi:hypothetical protein